jgi:F-type H+-transporting ATPase subunit b
MFSFRLSTFIFQLINFFVLLAVLTWFFYRPLLRAMQRREEEIASRLRDADERERKAEAERQQLAEQSRRAQADAEALLARARTEGSQATEQMLERAHQEVARLLDEAKQRAQEQERTARQRLEARLRQTVVATSGSLIREAAGPLVHQGLMQKLLAGDLGTEGQQADLLRQALSGANGNVIVQLAYPSTPGLEEQFQHALAKTLGREGNRVSVTFQTEPSLVAGVRILVGTVAVDLSLKQILEALSLQENASGGSRGQGNGMGRTA